MTNIYWHQLLTDTSEILCSPLDHQWSVIFFNFYQEYPISKIREKKSSLNRQAPIYKLGVE